MYKTAKVLGCPWRSCYASAQDLAYKPESDLGNVCFWAVSMLDVESTFGTKCRSDWSERHSSEVYHPFRLVLGPHDGSVKRWPFILVYISSESQHSALRRLTNTFYSFLQMCQWNSVHENAYMYLQKYLCWKYSHGHFETSWWVRELANLRIGKR